MKNNKKGFTFFEIIFTLIFICVVWICIMQFLTKSKNDNNIFQTKCEELQGKYYTWQDSVLNKCYFAKDDVCYSFNCLEKREFFNSNFK